MKSKKTGSRPKIFVQIASYRDPECQHTVRDLFEKARHPERVSAGICWQFDSKEDKDCFEVEPPYPKQVRMKKVHPRDSRGACWARAETQKLWQGEEYTLQIDSHMRFERDWDELLIEMLAQCPSEKAILSCYPPGYTPPDTVQRGHICTMKAKHFDDDGILRIEGYNIKEEDAPPAPVLGSFCAAGFLFGPSQIIADVPYDPYLYFYGEENTLAARLWTHGWDIYHPQKLVTFHLYHTPNSAKKKTHFGDHKDWSTLNRRSLARALHLLGAKESRDPEVLRDIEKYGNGKARTLEEYQRWSGVDFKNRVIHSRATTGFERPVFRRPALRKAGDHPRIFVQIASYRDPECQHTVKDLFLKAKHPERINVGICWQYDPAHDRDCFEVAAPYPEQVRALRYRHHDSKGGCWARAEAMTLLEDEDYVLQIDAHMRFVKDWDEAMIETLARCPSKRAGISTLTSGYTPPDQLQEWGNGIPIIHVTTLGGPEEMAVLSLGGVIRNPQDVGVGPQPTPFFVGNFLFIPAAAFREAPIDPHIYFRGQEPVYSARLFTHGWDLYMPDRVLIYHYWESQVRKTAGQADYKTKNAAAMLGRQRVLHVLEVKPAEDPKAVVDIEKYGMGKARTLADFWAFADVDLKRGILGPKAKAGRWTSYEPAAFSLSTSYRARPTLDMQRGVHDGGKKE